MKKSFKKQKPIPLEEQLRAANQIIDEKMKAIKVLDDQVLKDGKEIMALKRDKLGLEHRMDELRLDLAQYRTVIGLRGKKGK